MASTSCPFPPHGTASGRSHVSPSNEFTRIKQAYPLLASTGCTEQFCQAGRIHHTDEDRVGRNEPLDIVERDAVDFLQQLRHGGVIKSESALSERVQEVQAQIRRNATTSEFKSRTGVGADSVRSPTNGVIGGTWWQTYEELEFGVRVAWKHARKCIMRSEYRDLKLCDLRHVRSSLGMATELISALKTAFNDGEIRPTVFVFPPRRPDERGPMIWNPQLLSFAGYVEEDGSVVGDRQNIDLTKAIVELGWTPPALRTKWDLLPLVTMAQGEKPVITEVPRDLFPLVSVEHPKHKLAFKKLGLRWVPAPALSRLGMSIGGVQYTASPFIGWFMDAEVGVRDLVDPFRYNVLPQVVKAMGLVAGDLDCLPDFERLALLSRAQLELNYAVSYSYAKAGVRMIDSLGASEVFSRFDDDHLAEKGYRLPSDPYWLAPPQGSIIPLWHRGASPNYQPKPMICHHVQDPVKAWRRENNSRRSDGLSGLEESDIHLQTVEGAVTSAPSTRRVFTEFCSSGTVAIKLCKQMHIALRDAAQKNPAVGCVMPVQSLNGLKRAELGAQDLLIIIASNTRRGEIPHNGKDFLDAVEKHELSVKCSFAVFGNGSLDYPSTFNQTAKVLDGLLRAGGASPQIEPVLADTAAEYPPWNAFETFKERLLDSLNSNSTRPAAPIDQGTTGSFGREKFLVDTKSWTRARIQTVVETDGKGMKRVVLDVGNDANPEMSYLSILPPNDEEMVRTILQVLRVRPDEHLHFAHGVTTDDFFRFHVDIEQPFQSGHSQLWGPNMEEFATLPVAEAIARLPSTWRHRLSFEELCRAMPRSQPRKYSVASDHAYATSTGKSGLLELLVQHHPGGKFSDLCLGERTTDMMLACKMERNAQLRRMAAAMDRPLIVFATGSGIAPVRSLLQYRAERIRATASESAVAGESFPPVSLFAAYKEEDESTVQEALSAGVRLDMFDILRLMPSNTEKRRVQDEVFEDGIGTMLVQKVKDGALVFVCANAEAAADFLDNLSALLGRDLRDALGERCVAEVYQPAV